MDVVRYDFRELVTLHFCTITSVLRVLNFARGCKSLKTIQVVGPTKIKVRTSAPVIIITSRGSPHSASFHCYGAPSTTFTWQRFYNGASTPMILVIMMWESACFQTEVVLTVVNPNDQTRSDI